MFGRTKTEDTFETEARLSGELETARRQLTETAARIMTADAEYRRAAVDAITSGVDDGACKLRQALDKLGVRKDGLEQQIKDLEPKLAQATGAAQSERLRIAEAARRERLAALVAEGQAAVEEIQTLCEPFARAISRLDDIRTALATTPEFNASPTVVGNTITGGHAEGAAEAGRLTEMLPQAGPHSLRGRLLAAGWRERTLVRPTRIEIVGLAAPK
jgi:hypothetical protein